ncbi:MAG TPA: P-loop NTPase fold protein [Vicinamibacterales bacterium]|nr:P-loop NTPase fold protein [Vicinamibacterales bacterium]
MAPATGSDAAARSPIGLQNITELVLERISTYLAQTTRPEAWVVGVFGEWGSGKSTLLAEIARHFPNVPIEKPDDTAPITLRIEFNAWRYEREEHLLVPLLRTIERTLDDYADAIDALPIVEHPAAEPAAVAGPGLNINDASAAAAADALARTLAGRPEKKRERRTELAKWIGGKAKLAGLCAIAMTKAVKINVMGLDVAPAEAVKGVRDELALHRKAQEEAAARDAEPAFDAQSFYYNLFTHLRRLTRGDGEPDKPRLNLVFLIDDLDRCLPEKAVEMLESIKLFLDVQGCVFVLAVDDEVVERGIAHRYRDYLDLSDRAAESIAHSLQPTRYRAYLGRYATNRQAPITGSEYLEKIVQLAVRLPRFSRKQAADLLKQHAPELFVPSAPAPSEAASEWLLDLFLDAVPPVPRKLIRAADLLVFVRQLAERQGALTHLHGYTLAQLTLLQVFAPQMFRYLSRRDRLASWTRLDARLKAAQLEAGSDIYGASFFDWWEKAINKARDAIENKQTDPPVGVTLTELERYEEPFIAELRQACSGRSGFDPRKLFLPTLPVDRNLRPYINLLAEEATVTSGAAAPTMPPAPAVATPPAPTPAAAPSTPPTAPALAAAAPGPASPAAVQPIAPPPSPPPSPPPLQAPAAPAAAGPRELGNFVDLLLSPHEDSWHGALDSEPGLQGRVLDRRSFMVLRDSIAQRKFVINGRWLSIAGGALSDLQVKELLAANNAMAGATSEDILDLLAVGELIETACLKLRPWDAPVKDTMEAADIGLPPGVEATRREWAYRYRRGLIDATVDAQEPVEIWRGYPPSLSAPVHAVSEIKPGTLAISTPDGHVRLWSSAFRGQWAVVGHLAGPVAEGFRIAALSPVQVVGFSESTVAIWHARPFGNWERLYSWSQGRDLRSIAVLSPNRFVVMAANGLLMPFRSPTRGQWEALPIPVLPPQTVGGIAPLDEDHLVVIGLFTKRYLFTDKGLREEKIISLDHAPTSIVATARKGVFVTYAGGGVRLVQIDETGTASTLARESKALGAGQLTEANGNLALLRNEEAFEIWSTANVSVFRRIGEGSAGGGQHGGYPVGLLHDGRVASAAATSGLATLKPTVTGAVYDFDSPVVGPITWTPSVALTEEGAVLTHPAGAILVEAHAEDGGLHAQVTRVLRADGAGFIQTCALGAHSVLLLDSRRDIMIWNTSNGATQRISLGLPTAPAFIAMVAGSDRAYVAAGTAIHELVRAGDGSWAVSQAVFLSLTAVEGLARAADGMLLAWCGSTGIALAPDTLSTVRTFQLPGAVSSAVRVPAKWRGLKDSTLLICARGEMFIGDLESGSMMPWPLSTETIAVAAGFGDVGTVAFTADGSMLAFDDRGIRQISTQLLHGAPTQVQWLDRNVVLVNASDDAWYLVELPDTGAPDVIRLLMTPDALVVQDLAESMAASLRATPRVSMLLPLDAQLRSPEVNMPHRSVPGPFEDGAIPSGNAAKNLAALVRKNGELAEPSARPDTISWPRSSNDPSKTLALQLRRP